MVFSLILGLLAVILLLNFTSYQAAGALAQPSGIITVDTLVDEENVNGNCSLREAITAANINYAVDKCPAGGMLSDTVVFEVAGTITLTEQLPYILNAGPLMIDGGSVISLTTGYNGRLLWVNPGARLALQDLTIHNSGFQGYDYTDDTNGGGLYNNQGTVIINRCYFKDNTTWTGSGGAISSLGTITITQSVFTNNNSLQGGAINNSGSLYIQESRFNDNTATMWGSGGAISNDGMMEVNRSAFYQNSAEYSGGGIANYEGMRVINSTFSNNWVWDSGQIGGGGIDNSGMAEIEYSTFQGGVKKTAGGTNLSMNLVNCTDCFLTIQNSILTSIPVITNCLGTITDGGYNIDSQDSCGFDPANGSQNNTDPLLGPLQNNGGSTQTHAPLVGSPAIDAASPLDCPLTDQRGVPRPFDGDEDGEADCDIGAFEVVPPGVPRSTQTKITAIMPFPPLVNQPVIIGFQVLSEFGIPTGSVTVTVENSPVSCSSSLNVGEGSCELMLPDFGTFTMIASYAGAGDFLPSAGSQVHSVGLYGAFLPGILRDYPPAVQIVWSGIRKNRLGSYEMNGEALNVSEITVYGISLRADLYDSSRNWMGTGYGYAALPATVSGESNPFTFPVGEVLPGSYDIRAYWSYDTPGEYYPLSVLSQTISGVCPSLIVGGLLRNDQAIELEDIKVIVEPGGAAEIYGVADLGVSSLLPGQTTVFTHTQDYILPPCPTEFSVRGQGYQPP